MNRCDQGRRLFGAYWDDEVTQAEREWLESHFAGCPACRQQYEQFARTLEAVGSLPRTDTASDLPERALAAARRASSVPDRIAAAPATPRWVPITAAAALVLVAVTKLSPILAPLLSGGAPGGVTTLGQLARLEKPVAEPRLLVPAPVPGAHTPAQRPIPTLADSLFDHSEDVEFILDPVVLHRGRAQAASHLPAGVQGEHTVISF
ncbi:MAG TPA: zf-HC2 domain-containing protein [Candidatus Eisenbacteria bacterium]|jgi:anti-sigma factor RsiW